MTIQFDARMALTTWSTTKPKNVEWPGIFPLPIPELNQVLITTHWSANPELGMPVAPYLVEYDPNPLLGRYELRGVVTDAELGGGAAPVLDLEPFVDRRDASSWIEGILYVRAHVTIVDGSNEAAVFALDLSLEEIPDSRVVVRGAGPIFLFGPSIFRLAATAHVRLEQIHLGRVPHDVNWRPLEEVAAAFPGIPQCEELIANGKALSASDALMHRSSITQWARIATSPPMDLELRPFHGEDPLATMQAVLDVGPIAYLRDHYFDFCKAGGLEIPIEQQDVGDADGATLDVSPIAMLQLFAQAGSYEATALGCGTTLAFDRKVATSLEQVLETFAQSRDNPETLLPFPIIRVTGYFPSPEVTAELDRQSARDLALKLARIARPLWSPDELTLAYRVHPALPPPQRDVPAMADVELYLSSSNPGQVFVQADQKFRLADDGTPKIFLVQEPDGSDAPAGAGVLLDPQVAVPLRGGTVEYRVVYRDEFGRWAPPALATARLIPWPITRPRLLGITPGYGESSAWVDVRLSWPWDLRTPKEIALGLTLGADEQDPALQAVAAADGVTSPNAGTRNPLGVTFQADETPQVAFKREPPMLARVTQLRNNAPPGPDEREYVVRIPLGEADAVFSPSDQCFAAVIASAEEVVRPNEWSEPSERLIAPIADPRPPVLKPRPWQLTWSSRATPDGRSFALLDLPAPVVASDIRVSTWRIHESALFDFIAKQSEGGADPAIEAVRKESAMPLRLNLIQRMLTRQLTAHPASMDELTAMLCADLDSRRDGDRMEVEIPARQSGLEFFLLTVTSRAGVESPKDILKGMYGVAVPSEQRVLPPHLTLVSYSSTDALEHMGASLAVVSSSTAFEAHQVRMYAGDLKEVGTAEELFMRFEDFWEISVTEASKYQPDIEKFLERQPYPYYRVFMALPRQQWTRSYICAELVSATRDQPGSEVPSTRSAAVSTLNPPATIPLLRVTAQSKVDAGTQVSLNVKDLPAIVDPMLPRSRIGLRHDRDGVLLKVDEHIFDGSSFDIGVDQASLRVERDELVLLAPALGPNDVLTIVAIDPLGRTASHALS
ncbi:MAG: hypothetical protein SXG53_02400 [Pseudomonadota bacterium]|nr:hypothetical protein [Pseudomonadota bacterium]